MTKFCFIGDLHFEALNKYFGKETNPDRFIFEQLEKVVNYCRKVGIKSVFQLGDVFDQPYPDQHAIKEFLSFLHKNQDINFYIIAGNHDYSNIKTTSLEIGTFLADKDLLKNVKIFTKPSHLIIEGISVFFAPYPVFKKFDFLVGTPCLCLGHFEVSGAKHDSGQLIKTGVNGDLLYPEDFWVLGHLHRHQNIQPKIYYTGTTLQYNFGEPLPKGFTVSEISEVTNLNTTETSTKSLEVKHQYITLDTPYRLENVFINTQEEFDQIRINDPQYFYKIFLQGSDLILPQKFLNGSVHNIYKIIRNRSTTEERDMINSNSLSETFNDDCDKRKLFEPLGGLEDYLSKELFTPEEIQNTMQQIQQLSVEYKPSRN
jgi:DNA repair exonuclease SbcCD nuclease subunit